VEMFLEILGNTHVRATTSKYLAAKSKLLTQLVTDPSLMKERYPLVDIAGLKFRERDDMEETFAFWRQPAPKMFDMKELWDYRLRLYLKQRYDARAGVADWDYSMKLVEMGDASVIHVRQFIYWRATGMAFDLREAPYDTPNRTLASGRVFREKSGSVEKRGYWGDVTNSPYIGFGVEAEERDLFQKANKQHMKSTIDVAQYNIHAYLHEITTGTRYSAKVELHPTGETAAPTEEEGKVEEISTGGSGGGGAAADADADGGGDGGEKAVAAAEEEEDGNITIDLPEFKVHLLPMKFFGGEIATKSKYRGKFTSAYFSHSQVHHLKPEITTALAPGCNVTLEHVKFMLDLKPESKVAYLTKMTEFAAAAGLTAVGKHDATTDTHFGFKLAA